MTDINVVPKSYTVYMYLGYEQGSFLTLEQCIELAEKWYLKYKRVHYVEEAPEWEWDLDKWKEDGYPPIIDDERNHKVVYIAKDKDDNRDYLEDIRRHKEAVHEASMKMGKRIE